MTGPDLPLDLDPPTPGTPPSEEVETPLRPELLDGLDLAGCVKLRQHGIDCVEDLATVEPLELARSMEIGITRVMRLQFLARRLLLRRAQEGNGGDELREETLRPLRTSAPRFSPSETAFTFRAPELERELSSYVRRTAP
jgi:predicted RecB family nuclease